MFSRMSKQMRHLASYDFFSALKSLSELEKVFIEELDFGGPTLFLNLEPNFQNNGEY